MGIAGSDELAIRTVVVTTRAAVRSHRRVGQSDMARESAVRGLLLLKELGRARDLRNGSAEAFADARRELQALSEAP